MGDREPGQVRKEAALSGSAHAQWGLLAGAGGPGTASESRFDGGCTVTSIRAARVSDGQGSLYNRHRPTRFAELVGQEHVARALGNSLASGRPARGYLFSGPRGTGKTTTARILARCLNCQSFPAPTAEPCGVCDSCRRTGHDDWLDVVEVDAASSARRIDEMRDWLETVRYAPVACRYRVTIMDEAHQIQEGAASALLKTLEEPPPHLVVILCTTHPWDILPTIRSRLQHYVLRRPGVANLMRVLEGVSREEGIETTTAALDLVARAADGSYRDALSLLDQLSTYAGGRVEAAEVMELLGAVERETLFELVDLFAGGDAAGAFERLQDALDGGADPEQLMRGLVQQLRYALLLQQGAHPARGVGADRRGARAPARAGQPAAAGAGHPGPRPDGRRPGAHPPRGAPTPGCSSSWWRPSSGRPALDAHLDALAGRLEALERGAPARAGARPPPAIGRARPRRPAPDAAAGRPRRARPARARASPTRSTSSGSGPRSSARWSRRRRTCTGSWPAPGWPRWPTSGCGGRGRRGRPGHAPPAGRARPGAGDAVRRSPGGRWSWSSRSPPPGEAPPRESREPTSRTTRSRSCGASRPSSTPRSRATAERPERTSAWPRR